MLDLAAGRLRETADVDFVNDRLGEAAAEMAVALPVKLVVDDDAFRRTQDAALRRKEVAGQRLAIWVDQPGLRVEAIAAQRFVRPISLQMIKLARPGARNEHAPDVPPAVQIGIELDDVGGVGIVDALIEQHPHGGRAAAEDDELHPPVVYYRTVRKGMSEFQGRLPLRHGGGLNGAISVSCLRREAGATVPMRRRFDPLQPANQETQYPKHSTN